MDSCLKHDSEAFVIDAVFEYDKYFSSYSREKKIKFVNFVWKKQTIVTILLDKYATKTFWNGLEVKTV